MQQAQLSLVIPVNNRPKSQNQSEMTLVLLYTKMENTYIS